MAGSCHGIKKTVRFNFNDSNLDGRRWIFFYFVDPTYHWPNDSTLPSPLWQHMWIHFFELNPPIAFHLLYFHISLLFSVTSFLHPNATLQKSPTPTFYPFYILFFLIFWIFFINCIVFILLHEYDKLLVFFSDLMRVIYNFSQYSI
jgi:hypothetical protein